MADHEPAGPQARGETVLAEGRLHPATLLLRLASLARRFVIFAVIVAIQVARGEGGGFWALFFGVALLGTAATALVDYLHYRYRLTTRELQITRGAISRRERRIPVDRIQDLSSVRSPLHRLLGVVKVSVETASAGREAEADIDAITPADADRLREALKRAGGPAPEEAEPGPEEPLLRLGTGALLLRGLTDNRAGLLLAGAAYLLDAVLDLTGADPLESMQRVIERAVGTAASTNVAVLILAGGLVGLAVLAVGWALSALATWLRYHGFTLIEREGVFQRRFGLLTTQAHSLPRRRIQALRIEQTWLRLLVGVAIMRTDNAGSAAEGRREAATRSVFVPAGRPDDLASLVPTILPGADLQATDWASTSPKIVRRFAVRGLVLGVAIAAGAFPFVGPVALTALLLAIPFAVAGSLALRRLGYALDPEHLRVRWGIVGLYRAVVPLRAMQSVELRRSPFERLQGLGRIVLHVAGGASVTVPNLPLADARTLLGHLGTGAADHPFVL